MKTSQYSMDNKPTANKIDLKQLYGEFLDHKILLFIVTISCMLIVTLYVFLATPIYQADALVQVEQKQGNAILDSINQFIPDSQPISAPEIGLLQSRMILGKAIDALNLQTHIEPKYFPLIGAGVARIFKIRHGTVKLADFYIEEENGEPRSAILEVISNQQYKLTYDGEDTIGNVGEEKVSKRIRIKVLGIDALPGEKFKIIYYSKGKAIDNLLKNYKVADQGKDTGMLNLTITGPNKILNENILNKISSIYLEQNIARQAAQDEKSLQFLDAQLPKVRSDLNVSEDRLNEYRRKKDSVDLSLEAKSLLDQIVNVDDQLNLLTFKEAEISQLYTKDHPTYKALLEKRKTLESDKSSLNKKVSAMPATQQEILRLSRDVESGRAVYMQLLNRQQELAIAKSSAIGNVRIIDSALTDPEPVKPKKAILIIISFIMGLLLAGCIILLKVFMRNGIESHSDLTDIGVNVYANIPMSDYFTKAKSSNKTKIANKDICLSLVDPTDFAIESIRNLRTSLHFAMMESKNKVLMITGATPKVGKTFISTNLAVITSQIGKKVLLIDSDMRRGYIHKTFSLSNTNGLSDYLSGKSAIETIVKKVDNTEVDVVTRGAVPPNPAELLMHERFAKLLAWAEERYDLIIIDTPPVLSVTDPSIVGSSAGTSLLVARFEQNTVNEIELSLQKLENDGVKIKGCILNGVMKRARSYYGYGYNYSYEYKKSENK